MPLATAAEPRLSRLAGTLAALLRAAAAARMAPTLPNHFAVAGSGQQRHSVPRPPAAFSGAALQRCGAGCACAPSRTASADPLRCRRRRCWPRRAVCPVLTPLRRCRRRRTRRPQRLPAAPPGPGAARRRAAQPRLPGAPAAAPRLLPPPAALRQVRAPPALLPLAAPRPAPPQPWPPRPAPGASCAPPAPLQRSCSRRPSCPPQVLRQRQQGLRGQGRRRLAAGRAEGRLPDAVHKERQAAAGPGGGA